MRSGLPAVAAFIASLLLWPAPGKADFQICNLTTSTAEIAFGYYEPQDGWSSRGWMKLQLGECKIALRGPLQYSTYYIYGHTEDGREFIGPSSQNGGFFCIQKPKFELHSNALTNGQGLACEASGLKAVRFLEVKVKDQDYTYTLNPNLGQIGNALAPIIRQGLQSGSSPGTGINTYFPSPTSSNTPEPPVAQPAPSAPAPPARPVTSGPALPPASSVSVQGAPPPPPVARTQTVVRAKASTDPSNPSNPSNPFKPSQSSPAGTACERFPNLC
jgi:uncharacterized membrane protein